MSRKIAHANGIIHISVLQNYPQTVSNGWSSTLPLIEVQSLHPNLIIYIYIYVYNLNLRVLLPSDVEDSGSHPSFLAPELFKYLLPYWISALPIPTSLAMTSKTSPPRPMISPMPCPKLNCLVNAWEAPSNSETKLRRDLELGKSGSYKCDRNMQLSASWIDISTHVSLSKKPTGIAGNQHEPSQSW